MATTQDVYKVKTRSGVRLKHVTEIADHGGSLPPMQGARTYYVNGELVAYWSYKISLKKGKITDEKITIVY